MPSQSYFLFIMVAYLALILSSFRMPSFKFLDKGVEGRDTHLDGLRFFLAIAVVFHHCVYMWRYWHLMGWNSDGYPVNDEMGRVAVSGFFMLSAYLFAERRLGQAQAILRYFLKRFLRVLPLAYFSAGLSMALAIYLNYRVDQRHSVTNIWFWRDILISPFYPYVGTFASTSTFNVGVMWTLSFEWGLYISLPLIVYFRHVLGRFHTIFFQLAATVLLLDLLVGNFRFIAFFPLGMLAKDLQMPRYVPRLLQELVLAILISSILYRHAGVFSTASIISLFLAFWLITSGATCFGLLHTRAAVRLGEASYSLYLLHGIVLFLFNKWVTPLGLSNIDYVLALFPALWCACTVSTLTYRFIEKPFMVLGQKI